MKLNKIKILTSIAIINVILLGLLSYFNQVMFSSHLTTIQAIDTLIILFCIIGSVITKCFKKTIQIIMLSSIFDLFLIVYLYSPREHDSIFSFLKSFIDLESLYTITPFYLYLIVFYILMLLNIKKKAI